MDQFQLALIQGTRAHLRDHRHMGTFNPERWVGFMFEGAAYRARGYVTSAGLMFDLYGAKDGRISKDALYTGLPVIPQIACVKDEYARAVVRCQSLTRGHPWVIEQGVAHSIVIAEYEVLPGDQEAEERGMVYLASPEGEFLAVEGHYLTVFQPICDPDARMSLESVLTQLNLHLLEGEPTDSSDVVDTLFIIEKSLNSGHIEMIATDPVVALTRAIQTLEKEGLTRTVVDLYTLRDKLSASAPAPAELTFGAAYG